MTVANPTGSEVAPYSGDYGNLGLEDVDASDLSLPRLSIKGAECKFENSVTKEQSDYLDVILLAQVKQRIMWHKDQDDNYKKPQCRSADFRTGFPNVDPKAPGDRLFPWRESNFDQTAGPQGLYNPEMAAEGLVALPCDSCKFKDWHDKKTRCKEQHTYALLVHDAGQWTPAILTVQGSGIKNSRSYVQQFATARSPLFTVSTRITLTAASRGSVQYAIPNFVKGQATSTDMFDEYAQQLRTMQDYLRRPPRAQDDSSNDAPAPSSNVNTPAVVPLPGQVPAPVAAPVAQIIEHEPPHPPPAAPPVQTAASPVTPPTTPVAPAPPAPPAPVPAAVVAPPVAPPAAPPVAPPPAPAAVPAPPAPPAPAPVAAAPAPLAPGVTTNDDLPF